MVIDLDERAPSGRFAGMRLCPFSLLRRARRLAVLAGLAGLLFAAPSGSSSAAPACETPPLLVDPIVYRDLCPGDAGFPTIVSAGGRDVYVKLPKDRQCTKRLLIKYAHNVRIFGGAFNYNSTSPNVIAVQYSSGTTFIEGLDINVNGLNANAISSYAHTGRMLVQNTLVRGVSGSAGGTVRDAVDAQTGGPLADLTLQNVTMLTSGRGLYAYYNPSNGHGARKLKLDRVNAAYDTRFPKWPAGTTPPKGLYYIGSPTSTTRQAPPDGTILADVYADGGYWGLPYQKTVYAEPKPQPDGCATFSSDKFSGKVCLGPPPEGDFAPAGDVGLNYDRTRFCGSEPVNQCDASQVPAQAAALGLTRLAFCDDFSTDTVARGDTAAARDMTAGKKWTSESAVWGPVTPAADFRHNADGTLTLTPSFSGFNWNMSSTVYRNGALKGFWIAKKPRWFAEIRWKFQKGTSAERQPAFWSMDACHLYLLSGTGACVGGTLGEFIEPDWWEYVTGNSMGLHWYAYRMDGSRLVADNKQSCGGGHIMPPGENTWFTAGILYSGSQQLFVKDGSVYYTRKGTETCSNNTSMPALRAQAFFNKMKTGDYPILIGAKNGEIITIDYVRVWQHPADQ